MRAKSKTQRAKSKGEEIEATTEEVSFALPPELVRDRDAKRSAES